MKSNRSNLRIGMLTPSSNTVLEPMVAQMLRYLPNVTAHFSRFPVKEILLNSDALDQFSLDGILNAAALLADANVHVIGWNGTSASWLGFDHDEKLCSIITERHGVPATSAVLAINEILDIAGAQRIAMVTPYVDDVQDQILKVYEDAGYSCVAESHAGEHINYAFAEISEDEITRAVREVADAKPDAIVIMCTNLRGARLAHQLEQETGIMIVDSIAAFVWKAVRQAGVDPQRLDRWGRMFSFEMVV